MPNCAGSTTMLLSVLLESRKWEPNGMLSFPKLQYELGEGSRGRLDIWTPDMTQFQSFISSLLLSGPVLHCEEKGTVKPSPVIYK